jgi:hypothetical protein
LWLEEELRTEYPVLEAEYKPTEAKYRHRKATDTLDGWDMYDL